MKHRIDMMSRKILEQAAGNSGYNVDVIAEAVGCAPAVVVDRIAKLQEDGIIRRFCAQVDLSGLTGHHEALVVGKPSHETNPEALGRLAGEADVSRVYTMASAASVAFHVHGKKPDEVETRAATLAALAGLTTHRCTHIVSSFDGQSTAQVRPITAPAAE
jgi:DNA-binding Lrp family transcriptional regulator